MFATDIEPALFSAKTFLSAILAYYISLRIGFSQPVWAVITAYLVAQPFAGAVISKALFRLLGTGMGGVAATIFLPEFVNQPLLLSVVLAAWLGLCVYIAQLDRTPRSYMFLLAGYTTSVIGFASVNVPGTIFNTAVLRVEEIGIGVVAAALIHGLVFPRTATGRLRQQVSAIVSSAEQWSLKSLAGSRDLVLDRERRRLATHINEIDQISYHVAFDTERLVPLGMVVRALQDQLSWVLPLSVAVEDRVAECGRQEIGIPNEVKELIATFEDWLETGIKGPETDRIAHRLIAEATRIQMELSEVVPWSWREMLLVNLLSRLEELVGTHQTLRELLNCILSGKTGSFSPEVAQLIVSAKGRTFHRDHGLALRTAVGTAVAVVVVCIFWIMTAWPSGAGAALIVGVGCSLIGTLPNPGIAIRRFVFGVIVGELAATGYAFIILPRVTDFVMLAVTLAPLLLLFGSMMPRPPLAARALGCILGFVTTVGLTASYQPDFAAFANAAVAELGAAALASVVIGISHVVGIETAFQRLYRAGFHDISARADGKRRDTRKWILRMIDRIALISARIGPAGVHPALPPYDAVTGLRIGYLAGELRNLVSILAVGDQRNAVNEVLVGLSAHFRSLDPVARVPMGDSVLDAIDRAMSKFAKDPKPANCRTGIILLTGLRRALFPTVNFLERTSP
jgi:uncharacterized membrane protein YccC